MFYIIQEIAVSRGGTRNAVGVSNASRSVDPVAEAEVWLTTEVCENHIGKFRPDTKVISE